VSSHEADDSYNHVNLLTSLLYFALPSNVLKIGSWPLATLAICRRLVLRSGQPVSRAGRCYNLPVLYWECKRRLKNLRDFRGLVDNYIVSLGIRPGSDRTAQSDESHAIRTQINLNMSEALESCDLIGEITTVGYSYQGYTTPLNLIRELFDLRNDYYVSPEKVTDVLDRAIGKYEQRKRHLYWQMFNPLFWLRLLLVEIIEIPFWILGAAGFDAARIEKTTIGRMFKAVAGFVTFVAALLTVLHLLGWLDPAIRFVHSLPRRR
jgi:hypothetical protein